MKLVLALAAAVAAAAGGWQSGPQLPVARTEVAAAVSGGSVVVAGGYVADGSSSARVDLFDPGRSTWRAGPTCRRPSTTRPPRR